MRMARLVASRVLLHRCQRITSARASRGMHTRYYNLALASSFTFKVHADVGHTCQNTHQHTEKLTRVTRAACYITQRLLDMTAQLPGVCGCGVPGGVHDPMPYPVPLRARTNRSAHSLTVQGPKAHACMLAAQEQVWGEEGDAWFPRASLQAARLLFYLVCYLIYLGKKGFQQTIPA